MEKKKKLTPRQEKTVMENLSVYAKNYFSKFSKFHTPGRAKWLPGKGK